MNTFLELTRIQKWSKKSEVADGPNPAREPAAKWLCGLPGPTAGLFSSTVSRPILTEDVAKAAARPSRRRRWRGTAARPPRAGRSQGGSILLLRGCGAHRVWPAAVAPWAAAVRAARRRFGWRRW
jgi:hypothetical protein